jgi:hypothetical protein
MSLKLLYFSCHETLEHDELRILQELGFQVFSLGHYLRCQEPVDASRGTLELNNSELLSRFLFYHPEEAKLQPAQRYKMIVHPDFLSQFDVIYNVFYFENILSNLANISGKPVIHRTIGLSVPYIENCIANLRINHNVKTIGYSQAETGVPGYSGRDVVIRQPIDESVFRDWRGDDLRVITVTKAMKKRRHHCRFDIYEQVTESIGPGLGEEPGFNTLENHKFVELCSDNIDQLREYITYLFQHEDFARDMSGRARQIGIENFGYSVIKAQYKQFLQEQLCISLT